MCREGRRRDRTLSPACPLFRIPIAILTASEPRDRVAWVALESAWRVGRARCSEESRNLGQTAALAEARVLPRALHSALGLQGGTISLVSRVDLFATRHGSVDDISLRLVVVSMRAYRYG